ncbi:GNAT family N-acetyltransferase [Streptomyces carminius]|uniref:GNAT family N-acetyltransferase n=1 Tax=Streptomyces carminius TaxID=2665496 RepID=A0A2M8LYA4_9ACTN|nr:GNAT family N-acetyltransferase [Streptomyces carminius]PJE96943.1 GNAT family N-acetyltransferase [Streptomyces carminius]
MGNPRIRPFAEADLPGAAAALVEVHATDGCPVEGVADPEAWLRSESVSASWVAEADDQVVGHVAVMSPNGEDAVALWARQSGEAPEDVAVLGRLFVIKNARRRALGEELTRTATAYAQARGLRLVLDVMTKDTAAIRLYERLGWRRIGETTHHYGDGRQTGALCYAAPPS